MTQTDAPLSPTAGDLTYNDYLHVPELLALQELRSQPPHHDEMLFIIIHQVYELWFKQVLHELDYLIRMLVEADRMRSLHTLRRILTILKIMVAQIDILETMTPVEFLSFRPLLESASGFESQQFREMEFVLGHKKRARLAHFPEGSDARARLEKRFTQPTLWDAFLRFLANLDYPIPQNLLTRDVSQPIQPSAELQTILIEIYRDDPIAARISERLIDLDEGLQEWRYRHVKMVERTIGAKTGTGGSTGVAYLQKTLLKPIFLDLWAIRSAL